MSVINGQIADQNTFNAAFASKQSDNTLTGQQTLARPSSGATVTDVQQAINDNIADILAAQADIDAHEADTANPHAVTKAQVGLGSADNTSDLNKPVSTAQQAALDLKIDLTEKGAANGVAPLNGSSKIDATYLPSYVDDVLEYANLAAFPVTGETGKIYVALDTNLIYRWSGSIYVEISEGIPMAYIDTDGTLAANSDVKVATQKATKTYADSKVADAINDGVTTIAPSQNAVYDSLALKQNSIQFQDEGSNLGTSGTVTELDFAGSGVTASRSLNKVTVTISGGGSGTVTSVALASPSEFTVSGSPVTTSGTLTLNKANQSANTVWAGPSSGGAAAPAFRALVYADQPLRPTRSVSSTDTATTADYVIFLSGASFTETLYTAVGNAGRILEFIHTGTSNTQVYTIDANGSQTIGGSLTKLLHTNGQVLRIISDGTNWQILESRTTIDLGTESWTDNQANATTSVRIWRIGSKIRVEGEMTMTGAMSGQPTVTIPTAYTANSRYTFTNTRAYLLGLSTLHDTSASAVINGFPVLTASTTITLYVDITNGTYDQYTYVSATAPFTWASGDSIAFDAEWEVAGWET